MPARKLKRKVLKRTCKSESALKQKAKTKCEVCSKIAGLMKASRVRNEYFNSRVELGLFDDVIRRSVCSVHPRMLKRILDGDGNLHQLGNEEISFFLWGMNQTFGITIRNSYGSLVGRSLSDLVLVPTKCRIQSLHRGRILSTQYVDTNLLRRWRRLCDSQQHEGCRHNPIQNILAKTPPTYLIDTWSMCLVPGFESASYVALSYVWGKEPFFQTTKANIHSLQADNALSDSHNQLGLPRTISDAISVVQLLDERYLWVDALCIVQDDKEMKHGQVKDMASIFANASITIMAHQGEDANYGL